MNELIPITDEMMEQAQATLQDIEIARLKQRIVAHRGNLYGEEYLTENSPEAILHAIENGYAVEFDFRVVGDLTSDFDYLQIGLGHDESEFELTSELMDALLDRKRTKAFLHARDGISFLSNYALFPDIFQSNLNIDLFYNDKDTVAITMNGCKWIHPDFDSKFDLQVFGVIDDSYVFVLGEDQWDLALYLLKYTEANVCCDYGAIIVAELQSEIEPIA